MDRLYIRLDDYDQGFYGHKKWHLAPAGFARTSVETAPGLHTWRYLTACQRYEIDEDKAEWAFVDLDTTDDLSINHICKWCLPITRYLDARLIADNA